VVVAVGLTLVEPLGDVEVNVPGVMAILAAPVVAQLSVLLEPEAMLAGLAVKELMVGFASAGVADASLESPLAPLALTAATL
jgi:hypothetical protein